MKGIRVFGFMVGVVLAVQFGFVPGSLSNGDLGSTLYKLTDDSNYIEGCFDPCMCPIFLNQTFLGSFFLTPVPPGEGTSQFEVSEVEWQFFQGEETISVTGSGQYRIEAQQHRLTMDLLVGHDPVQTFDSGLVPVQGEFPGIIIAISLNGFFCYDRVFEICAVPAPVGPEVSSWGSLKSNYR